MGTETDTWQPEPFQPLSAEAGQAPTGRVDQGGRTALYVSLFVVSVLAASALFVSGFALGRQDGASPGTPESLQANFQPFWDAYTKIDREFVGEVDQQALIEGAIGGLFQALGDPYSGYMTSQQYEDSLRSIGGQFEGIGAELSTRDPAGDPGCQPAGPECELVVVRVLPESPALAAGLEVGDRFVAVDGQRVEGETIEQVVDRVRGERGTAVTLTIARGEAEPFDLEIVRDVIREQEVTSRVLAGGRVGYLRVEGFNDGSADDLKAQLTELVSEEEVDSLILDLRDDPGGFVSAARTVASQFIASGPIYYEETASGTQTVSEAEPGGIATDAGLELVVLVNGGTASASEIVAGALQDTGRATVIGTTTFGKGTIQQWQLLEGAGGFRLSVAKWLTPDKTWIHDVGITPDVVVDEAPTGPDDDPVLDRALEVLVGRVGGEVGLGVAA